MKVTLHRLTALNTVVPLVEDFDPGPGGHLPQVGEAFNYKGEQMSVVGRGFEVGDDDAYKIGILLKPNGQVQMASPQGLVLGKG